MEEWISFSPWRRDEWKSHRSKKAVRQAMAYDRRRGRLRIFVRNDDGPVSYIELAPAEWDATFAEEAG